MLFGYKVEKRDFKRVFEKNNKKALTLYAFMC